MTALTDVERDLLGRIAAATPVDITLIISGGWGATLNFEPLLTNDLDVALREQRSTVPSLLDGLHRQGFEEEPRGDENRQSSAICSRASQTSSWSSLPTFRARTPTGAATHERL